MIRIEFSDADKKALDYERCHHSHARVRKMIPTALALRGEGVRILAIVITADQRLVLVGRFLIDVIMIGQCFCVFSHRFSGE
jgi:hypothetical protein